MNCKEKLIKYFRENRVSFQVMHHPLAYTAQEVAAAQNISGKLLAKVVMLLADEKPVMMVLPSNLRLDLVGARAALHAGSVRLAREDEFERLFPDCESGAMPPFGNLYNVPTYVDRVLSEDEQLVFQIGTHRDTMQIAYADYARLVKPIVVEVAAQDAVLAH